MKLALRATKATVTDQFVIFTPKSESHVDELFKFWSNLYVYFSLMWKNWRFRKKQKKQKTDAVTHEKLNAGSQIKCRFTQRFFLHH